MAATFAQQMGDGSLTWRAESRGTDVQASLPVCDVAAGIAGDPATAGVKSRAVGTKQIDNSDLVIVASLRERAALTRLRPDARARIFTLREAIHLAEGLDAVALSGDVSPVKAFAAQLDERRGIVMAPAYRPRRIPFARREHPYDIPDVHGGSDRRHRRVLLGLRASTRELGTHLQRFIDASTSVSAATR